MSDKDEVSTSSTTGSGSTTTGSGDEDEKATTNGKPGETTKPAEPTDDLVTTKHTLKVGRHTLAYTATTGRVVLREEVFEDGKFTGNRAKAEMSVISRNCAVCGVSSTICPPLGLTVSILPLACVMLYQLPSGA